MQHVTIDDYWMPHDQRAVKHAAEIDDGIRANAAETVRRLNLLLDEAVAAGVVLERSPITKTYLSSGWRNKHKNATTKGAAVKSKHMTGQAGDIYDPNDGDLDNWLMTPEGQAALARIGLWLEHPAATKGWAHVQIVPPGSGRRTFYP